MPRGTTYKRATVLQNLQRTFIHVITSVADPGCLSLPDPASEFFLSRIRIKKFEYFYTKKLFLSSRKSDPDFITRPGSKGQKGTRSRIPTLVITQTALYTVFLPKRHLPFNSVWYLPILEKLGF